MKIVTAAEMREIDRVTAASARRAIVDADGPLPAVADLFSRFTVSLQQAGWRYLREGTTAATGFMFPEAAPGGRRSACAAAGGASGGDAAEMFTKLPVAPVTVSSPEGLKAGPHSDVLG